METIKCAVITENDDNQKYFKNDIKLPEFIIKNSSKKKFMYMTKKYEIKDLICEVIKGDKDNYNYKYYLKVKEIEKEKGYNQWGW